MSISISQFKYHYISLDQDRYVTSTVIKYLGTATTIENSKFNDTTLPHDMIFTKEDGSTSDEHVEVLSGEYKIHHRNFVG